MFFTKFAVFVTAFMTVLFVAGWADAKITGEPVNTAGLSVLQTYAICLVVILLAMIVDLQERSRKQQRQLVSPTKPLRKRSAFASWEIERRRGCLDAMEERGAIVPKLDDPPEYREER